MLNADKELELVAKKATLLERINNQRNDLKNLTHSLEKKCNRADKVADGINWLRDNKKIVGFAALAIVLFRPIKTIKLCWNGYHLVKFVKKINSFIK